MAPLAKIRAMALAILGLSLCTLASSCSYLLGDPYGSMGQRTVALADLNGIVKGATGADIQYVNGASANSAGGHDYLFLFVTTTAGTKWLIALDESTLSFKKAVQGNADYPQGSNIGVDFNGNFVIGNGSGLILSPTLGSVSGYSLPSGSFCLASDSLHNVSISGGSGSLGYSGYNSIWTTILSGPFSRPFASPDPGWRLVTAALDNGALLMLMVADSSGQSIALSYPNAGSDLISALQAVGYIVDDAPHKSAAANSDSNMAWVLREGMVVGNYSNGGLELDLYRFGDSGKSSSYLLTNASGDSLYFEPEGRFFFYYDPGSGRLFKLRTWW
ncbi:MAG TPA: hypothetical protein VMC79_12135 [Rectinemataceae bacterium]|nr:hypothetical protein [Rectinemataceae bacterium]